MAEDVYKPGETAPRSGIYQVVHQRHRASHEVTVLEGHAFPACRSCGGQVRFRLISAAVPVHEDTDFHTAGR
jgi:hypothetical protein